MKKDTIRSVWFQYVRQHLKGALLFLAFAYLMGLVLWLYRQPLEAVLYGALLCLVLGLICCGVDFYFYYQRHCLRQELLNRISLSIDGLPTPRNLVEEDYTQLLEQLHQNMVEMVNQMNIRRTDMMEYYTLWAHQIKTPIAAMGLLLQTEPHPLNNELSSELFRIQQYVDMVLGYLRMDGGSTDYVLRRYDLDSIIKQGVRKFAPQFIRKKISLQYEPVHAQVLTDEKWLLFVIEQLLSNAIKYTPHGTISIYLEDPLNLVIQDTGIGIQPEDLPRVFEKGYTGYNGRTDKKSTGIGLYLCKRILTKLGHEISISSQVGQGTKVTLHLQSTQLEVE